MSTSEPSTPAQIAGDKLPRSALSAASSLLVPVRTAAFWSAVALPLVYLPLVATGAVWDQPLLFCALLALNAVAFLVGHDHEPTRA
ncbi:hypothetical protein [Halolamina sp. C58]|uniref:hypothetical protein n=1 Tax=Halolamina sp. C58 TaxID=3421640 RepID=UPI003EBD11C0